MYTSDVNKHQNTKAWECVGVGRLANSTYKELGGAALFLVGIYNSFSLVRKISFYITNLRGNTILELPKMEEYSNSYY